MTLTTIDIAIVLIYAVGIFILAQWVSREKGEHEKNAQDYFLASRSLPWWAIGTSLIAANISAEQIIGMSGSGYVIGLGIASYEWMAALTLIIVGKYFLPIFLKNGIYTMPEFLEKRYSPAVRNLMAVFWLGVYIFVNLTSILWLGATAVHTVTGIEVQTALIAIGVFAGAYALYGGLKAVALTDVIQVSLLVLGGLIISYIALDQISGGAGVVAGFHTLLTQFPEKFDMILARDNPNFKDLPGLSVLLGGLWVMNMSYWGFNQYIIQRALAAKSVHEAQKGIVLAAFLKLLMPVIIVLPGIAALVLAPESRASGRSLSASDGVAADRHSRPGVRSTGRCDHCVAGLEDQFDRDDLHHGPVSVREAGHFATRAGAHRPHGRSHRTRDRHLHRQTVARQLRPGVPVHPGIHRLLHTGHLRDLPARHVLGTHHGHRRAGRRDRHRRCCRSRSSWRCRTFRS